LSIFDFQAPSSVRRHATNIPSSDMEHQSCFLQIGQGRAGLTPNHLFVMVDPFSSAATFAYLAPRGPTRIPAPKSAKRGVSSPDRLEEGFSRHHAASTIATGKFLEATTVSPLPDGTVQEVIEIFGGDSCRYERMHAGVGRPCHHLVF
jgi:hypothetical protein